MKKATLHSDGGARGNPGPAGIGYVLVVESDEPMERGRYIGETTNNIAEYTALIEGMQLALREEVTELTCFLDSELVVKQIGGQYRVKNEGLKPLYDKVCELIKEFEKITFTHVLRAKNKIADQLVNLAIDRKTT